MRNIEKVRTLLFVVYIMLSPNTILSQGKPIKYLIDTYSYDWMETKILKLYSDSTFEFFTSNSHTRLRMVKSGSYFRHDSTITLFIKKGYAFGIPIKKQKNRNNFRMKQDSILLFSKELEAKMEEWEIRHNTLTREIRK